MSDFQSEAMLLERLSGWIDGAKRLQANTQAQLDELLYSRRHLLYAMAGNHVERPKFERMRADLRARVAEHAADADELEALQTRVWAMVRKNWPAEAAERWPAMFAEQQQEAA